jgi:hypothetical protein
MVGTGFFAEEERVGRCERSDDPSEAD